MRVWLTQLYHKILYFFVDFKMDLLFNLEDLNGVIANNKLELETKISQFSIQMNLMRREKEELANQVKKVGIEKDVLMDKNNNLDATIKDLTEKLRLVDPSFVCFFLLKGSLLMIKRQENLKIKENHLIKKLRYDLLEHQKRFDELMKV